MSPHIACDGCGDPCCDDPFELEGEFYCDACAVALCSHVARGAIPRGGTPTDPASLQILGVGGDR